MVAVVVAVVGVTVVDMTGKSLDPSAEVAGMLEFLALRPGGEPGVWIGETPEWFGPYLFGGFVIAQAVSAATRDAPQGKRLHSLHAYYLRPTFARKELTYRLVDIRQGRAFTARRVEVSQDGKPVFDMACSFTADVDEDVYVYDLPGRTDDVPPVEDLEIGPGPGPWIGGFVGPTPPGPDGTRASTHRMWFRIGGELPDDPHLHTALLGFATDWTGIGGRPLHLDGNTDGMVSLDHAAWFHRPARADEWLFYDVHSLVNAGGRGLLRGVMRDTAGRVVVSVAQEMRLTKI
jgi:acyl-CoA thioesterase-2